MFGSLDPVFPLYPVCSCIGFVLSLIPLSWHIQAWNSGTCAFMIWTAIACILYFINSLIWASSIFDLAPVWCDISTKLIIGISIGIPASVLCISRRLYTLIAVQNVFITRQDKRRMMIGDLLISMGIPIIVMALHYVVQPHRYDIYEGIGCYPVVYRTLPSYFLVYMWPPLLGLCSAIYSSLTLHSFWVRRVQFGQIINPTTSMSMSRYFRLMLLALLDIVFTMPISICTIVLSCKGVPLKPWTSWGDTHFNFSRVLRVPAVIWRSDPRTQISLELSRWLPVFCAFLFFFLFGIASEARKQYRSLWKFVAGTFSRQPKNQVEGYLSGSLKPLKLSPPSFPTSAGKRSKQSTTQTLTSVSPSSMSFSNAELDNIKTGQLSFSPTLLPYGQPQSHHTPSNIESGLGSPQLSVPPPLSPTYSLDCGKLPMTEPVAVDAQLPVFPQLSHQHSRQTLSSRSPPHRRPFCSPSICPVTTPDLSLRGLVAGVQVTIRTERSYEEF